MPVIVLPELACPEDPVQVRAAALAGTSLEDPCTWVLGEVTTVSEGSAGATRIDLAPVASEVSVEGEAGEVLSEASTAEVLESQGYPQPRPGERLAVLGAVLTGSEGSVVLPVWAIYYVDRALIVEGIPTSSPSEAVCVPGTDMCSDVDPGPA